MAQSPTVSPAPITEAAFLADRQKFWSAFGKFIFGNVVAIVILLVGMAIFLL
jgi:hypothetical protein